MGQYHITKITNGETLYLQLVHWCEDGRAVGRLSEWTSEAHNPRENKGEAKEIISNFREQGIEARLEKVVAHYF